MNCTMAFDDWRKASYSNGSGSCVETASDGCVVAVRDTTNRHCGTLVFSANVWQDFVTGLRHPE